jgi:tRNA A64-2'-O-ribosylphosphate transferase
MFFPRSPTSDDTQLEYLYREEGVFNAGPGMQMTVNRRWIWRLSEPAAEDEDASISIHFVKADGETEDYLYNRLALPLNEPAGEHGSGDTDTKVLAVAAEHPCGQDFYISSYRFYLKEGALEKWDVRHEVKGPAKDYISTTTHTRNE